ncbi:Methyltransferase type 11 [Pseudopedobacter saltans DSM 12145]|uniref:Methyltransferase type 11 n=1 Tax=Pseudopedobacter saltans (strain ATCC 51119 / DSM 12145 / JCM 21818 / CCUG 39354 / LMG 10337 / NBRC 100064 / NCIMB 13643) TaxID=762903 RepID=F0S6R1_PSESL|nr:methyltransferase domain-containing protein [Pseudopedobacter saltans]ADY52171.1 Methyltransferase type 11 [Pseudopedobacter saltans DSM 12145]
MEKDIYGDFLKDYQFKGNKIDTVWLHNNYAEAEEMPVDVFFRKEFELSDLELLAIRLSKGKVLDIGAGAGAISLVLQRRGLDVTALELSAGACEVMKTRGVKKIINTNIFTFEEEKFDTLLLMMNGIGFCEYLDQVEVFLEHAKKLLNPNGQILFDSSDVSYLYETKPYDDSGYFGEIDYQYEYKGKKGEWFTWVYIEHDLMKEMAERLGYKMEILFDDGNDQYLARLTLK